MFRKIGIFCIAAITVLCLLSIPQNQVHFASAATCGTTNIALNKTATASSIEAVGTPASSAVDGNTTTRWSSAFSDPQWIQIDLGSTQTICQVILRWETAAGKSYQIQTSADAANWTSIYSTTTGAGGVETLTVSGSGRYIRMYGTARTTVYGYSLWEFEVYAGTTSPTNTNTPTSIPATATSIATTSANGSPFSGTPYAIPGKVEAENYNTGGQGVAYNFTTAGTAGSPYRTDADGKIEATSDTGGGYDVGWTATGEWMKYSVNVTSSSTYTFDVRVASANTGSALHLEVDGTNVTGSLTVPNTGGWQTWADVTKSGISLAAGQHVVRLVIDVGGMNLNWFSVSGGVASTATPTTIPATNTPIATATTSANGSPFSGTPYAIPGKVEAENYNTGGQGVAYNFTAAGGAGSPYRADADGKIEATGDTGGGYDVGWTATGEWMKYTVNATASGTYTFDVRVASANTGSALHLEVDGTNVTGSLTVPNTAGWQTWADVTKSGINVSAGQHVVRLVIDVGGMNINWFSVSSGASSTATPTFVPATNTPLPTVTPGGAVDFGPNVTIFDPSMSAASIQNTLNTVFTQQQSNQFGTQRNALLFKPGTYGVDANIGFYTQISGLGLSPNDVTINHVYADAQWFNGNGTQNFWRIAENMHIAAPDGINTWAVSQAAPFRRMFVNGELKLDPTGDGWSSGGFIADSVVTGQAFSGSQQQYITRSSEIGSWSNGVWNQVFVGVNGAPAGAFPNPPYTVVGQAPVVREKPFLYIDSAGHYNVFVPSLRTNTSGTTWNNKTAAGTSIPISQFFIVKPGATSADMNNALASGLNLLVTPGVYSLDQTLNITRANTVVLGMGLATFINNNGVTAVNVADVDGVTIAGLLFDAGTTNAPSLLQVGPSGASANHAANPTALFDIFARVGGAVAGKVTDAVIINSNNVIVDNTWLWRADHGSGIGWTVNTAISGLIVNGQNVTIYGLFVEHFQQYNVIWNANGGQVYFFQNELPYDPPNQAAYMNGATRGWAAYKVANNVTTHQAWGVGSYCNFVADPTIIADNSFEAPNTGGVVFHDLLTVSLGNVGTIAHIINGVGAQTPTNSTASDLVSYP